MAFKKYGDVIDINIIKTPKEGADELLTAALEKQKEIQKELQKQKGAN